MTLTASPHESPAEAADCPVASDEIFELLLHVARRADRLAGAEPAARGRDRRLWLRAEFEVLERLERARPRRFVRESA